MTVALVRNGLWDWRGRRDPEGHREYEVTHLVSTDGDDGPANVMQCPGLATPGSFWSFLDDVDIWAWCRADMDVQRYGSQPGESAQFYTVKQIFSTKPLPPSLQRCQDINIENPLLEPPKVGGSFVKYTEEAVHDRFGRAITSSSWEQMRGPQVEFDSNRPQVTIEMNLPTLDLALLTSMVDTVNNAPLWGFPRRCIKLTNAPWQRLYYGLCFIYYKVTLEFDINAKLNPTSLAVESGWDRDLLDEGTKVLRGHFGTVFGGETTGTGDDITGWVLDAIDNADPNPYNPQHFIRFKDHNGENARVVLNGAGLPAGVVTPGEQYFLSRIGGNLGNALSNLAFWLPVVGSLVPDPWTAPPAGQERYYPRGALVSFGGLDYISLADHIEVIGSPEPDLDPDNWETVLGPITDSGFYSAATEYSPGVVVRDSTQTAAGYIRVEKYPESNFLLLGIPLTF